MNEIAMTQIRTILQVSLVALLLCLTGCTVPRDYTYFQDFQKGMVLNVGEPMDIKLHVGDKVRISVTAQNDELSRMFRLSSAGTGSSQNGAVSFLIDTEGFVEIPFLGKVHVADQTRQEIQEIIKEKLVEAELVKDPIVTVDYDGLYVTFLGDMGGKRLEIDRDRYTILDAISSAGDLGSLSKRTNIRVIREMHGRKVMHEVNLCSAQELYQSPVYYLQQGDLIYIDAKDKKKRESTIFGNSVMQPGFWVGLLGMVVSVANFLK